MTIHRTYHYEHSDHVKQKKQERHHRASTSRLQTGLYGKTGLFKHLFYRKIEFRQEKKIIEQIKLNGKIKHSCLCLRAISQQKTTSVYSSFFSSSDP